MFRVQEMIHRFEEGKGSRVLKIAAIGLLLLALAVIYNLRAYQNFSSQEAMDLAQVGRNISQGKGFSTEFIRPLSVELIWQKTGRAKISDHHPDLANAPLYPAMLAGIMKVVPLKTQIQEPKERPFRTFQPEIVIAVFNQALLLGIILLTFFVARSLFDGTVAWLSAALVGGTELFWKFSISGLPSLLAMFLVLCLVTVLIRIDRLLSSAEPVGKQKFLLGALFAGAILGALFLTRYSYGCLLIPVVGYFLLVHKENRIVMTTLALVAFLCMAGPWCARNFIASGHFFGTAGYALLMGTGSYPADSLDRTLALGQNPPSVLKQIPDVGRKALEGARQLWKNDLPKMGGNWIIAFFLVSLLVPFSQPTILRIRRFLVFCLVLLGFVQILGRTYLSSQDPLLTSENLVVLLAPLLFIYGVALFTILLDQIQFSLPQFKTLGLVILLVLCSTPLFLQMLPPKTMVLAYPPYHPPVIQKISNWMKPNEITMSDMPWAVAWYAERRAVLLTKDSGSEFLRFNDEVQTVNAIYLTQISLDSRFVSEIANRAETWSRFGMALVTKGEVPNEFPLRKLWTEMFPEQLVLMDWDRWKIGKTSTKIN
jgi:hypothetical protein